MIDVQWAHALAGILGAVAGAVGGVFVGGYRVGGIEGKLALKIVESEGRLEERLVEGTQAFDETLRALRQKINDVELNTEKSFLRKDEFDDFRKEYREDMRELKSMMRSAS